MEALVEVREGIHKLGWAGEQAEGEIHRGGANGDDGGQVAHWRAQGNDPGGFYRPGALRGSFSRAS
jgi:hypothetical protein